VSECVLCWWCCCCCCRDVCCCRSAGECCARLDPQVCLPEDGGGAKRAGAIPAINVLVPSRAARSSPLPLLHPGCASPTRQIRMHPSSLSRARVSRSHSWLLAGPDSTVPPARSLARLGSNPKSFRSRRLNYGWLWWVTFDLGAGASQVATLSPPGLIGESI
jgi:hypothetical protein